MPNVKRKVSCPRGEQTHPEDEAKAARAYDQLRRGEIEGVLVTRMPSGRWAVKRMPRVLED